MRIRIAKEHDLPRIKSIHEKFFMNDFVFPRFDKFVSPLYLIEKDGEIITVGGTRTILEAIAITNMERSPLERYDALAKLFSAISLNSESIGYDQVHCFVKGDPNWERALKDHGFRDVNGKALVAEV